MREGEEQFAVVKKKSAETIIMRLMEHDVILPLSLSTIRNQPSYPWATRLDNITVRLYATARLEVRDLLPGRVLRVEGHDAQNCSRSRNWSMAQENKIK